MTRGPEFADAPRAGRVLTRRLRLAIALPGLLAATILALGGIYFVLLAIPDLVAPASDLASLSWAMAAAGGVFVILALMLAAASILVSRRQPPRLLLLLTGLLAASGAGACLWLLLAAEVSRTVYSSLTAVLAYLAAVTVLRLVLPGSRSNA